MRAEMNMAADLRRDSALREAHILALGDTVAAGKAALKELRQSQLRMYLRTLEAATIYGQEPRLLPQFRDVIENP